MNEEDKETTEDECVNHAIWETMHETLQLVIYDECSNLSNASSKSSEGLEIDTSEQLSASKPSKKKRKTKAPVSKENMPTDMGNLEEEIEEQLDNKAKKSKLTVNNVKNILKHVITNQHVMAMVKQSMRESGDVASSDEEFPYEPKLTRAKTKELQTKFAWPVTPSKATPASETKKLIEAELPEDEEDDEEYQPVEEEDLSDDENTSMASDLEPLTPLSVQSVTPNKSNADCSTQTMWTDDGLFRVPLTQEPEPESIVHRTRSKLCLSETPLEMIEKAFVPPDITTDMYDYEYDNEDYVKFLEEFTQPLNSVVNDTIDDEEDPEYNILEDEESEDKEELRADRAVKVPKKEVNELIAELLEFLEPDDDDDLDNGNDTTQVNDTTQECSFSALQEQREASQNNMYVMPQATPAPPAPLFTPSGVMSPANVLHSPIPMRSPATYIQVSPRCNRSPAMLIQSSPVTSRSPGMPSPVLHKAPDKAMTPCQMGCEEGTYILPDRVEQVRGLTSGVVEVTSQQRQVLSQQMKQHVQLLATCYMQSVIIPEMHCCTIETKENLMSLKFLGSLKPNSAFYASNLEDAIAVVHEWDDILKEDNPKSKVIKKHVEEEKERKIQSYKTKKVFEPRHCTEFLEVVSRSKAFIYPLLLPSSPFFSRSLVPRTLLFMKAEDILLVFGLEQFLPYIEKNPELHSKRKIVTMKKVSDLISEFILPAKTSRSIENHINIMRRVEHNVISMFFNHNKVPITKHFVIAPKRLTPREQPRELLPPVWRRFIYGET